MPVSRITAFVAVEETDALEVMEALLSLIDSFIIKNIAVFDSDVTSIQNIEVVNAEEIRREIRSDTA